MRRRKSIVRFAGNTLIGGTVLSGMESVGGTGTHYGADYMNAMSKPIATTMNIQGTGMVLRSLNRIRMPKLKRRK